MCMEKKYRLFWVHCRRRAWMVIHIDVCINIYVCVCLCAHFHRCILKAASPVTVPDVFRKVPGVSKMPWKTDRTLLEAAPFCWSTLHISCLIIGLGGLLSSCTPQIGMHHGEERMYNSCNFLSRDAWNCNMYSPVSHFLITAWQWEEEGHLCVQRDDCRVRLFHIWIWTGSGLPGLLRCRKPD